MAQQREVTLKTDKGEFRGVMTEATEIIKPGQNITVEARIEITHFDYFCIYCGARGLMHFLGTFKGYDGADYPFCVCKDCESKLPSQEPSE